MKERPILFKGEMVRAILSGQKTMTRRVVKLYPADTVASVPCPYGQPGDRLYVRESFSYTHGCGMADVGTPIWYWADGNPKHGDWTRPKPSIHMPRWACRIVLEIVGVRVERLHLISRGDAMEEGCPFPNMAGEDDPRQWFLELWESINGPESCAANPWVWVVEFKRVS